MIKIDDMIIDIDDNGFLEMNELDNKLVGSFSEFIPDAIELNTNIYALYDEIKPLKEDGLATFYLGTLERMHKDYQSILILLCRGLQSQARSIMRNLLEKIFIMQAIENDYNNLSYWIRTQNNQINRAKRVIKSDITHFTEEEKVGMDLKENDDEEPANYKRWSDLAGMEFDYEVIYKVFCADTHHSMAGMTKDMFTENGVFAGFSIAPSFESIDQLITTAMHYLLMAVIIYTNHLKFAVEWIDTLYVKLKALGFAFKASPRMAE